MQNQISLPRLNYIVFELVKIDIDAYLNNQNYKAQQVATEYLVVMPEQISTSLRARDAKTQTQSTLFLQKFNWAPENIRMAGTFGVMERYINGTLLDGWTRLQQFYENIIVKAKQTTDDNFIYALNFYNFLFFKFGSVNIDGFNTSTNARENTDLIRYTNDFSIIGPLIDVNGTDPLLKSLQILFSPTGAVGDIVNGINTFLSDNANITQSAGFALDEINIASGLISSAVSSLSNYGGAANKVYKNVSSLF